MRQAKGPTYQKGNGLGGIFCALMRVETPTFNKTAPVLKAGATAIARDAIRAGAEIANDALSGRYLAESAEQRAREAAGWFVSSGTRKLASMIEPHPKRQSQSYKSTTTGRKKQTAETISASKMALLHENSWVC